MPKALAKISFFFVKKLKLPKEIFSLDFRSSYAKILGKQIFIHGSFHEVGQKQKTEKKMKEKKERLNDGNNNGQYIRLNQ